MERLNHSIRRLQSNKDATKFREGGQMKNIMLPRMRKETDTVYISSGAEPESAFELVSNVFVLPSQSDGTSEDHAETKEEPEIFQDLDFYFEHLNDGRPFFLSCDPKSAALVKDEVIAVYQKKHPEFFRRMIAVYVDGVAEKPSDLEADLGVRLASYQDKGKIHVSESVKMLPKLIFGSATWGPVFVKRGDLGASLLAIGAHAVAAALFVISLFHGTNVALLNMLLDMGAKVSEGLYGLAGQIRGLLEDTLISLLSMIPGIGESLGSSLDSAAGASLDHAARYFSLEVSNFLNQLYDVIKLPEGLGFLLGLIGSILASALIVLLLKLLLWLVKHPHRKMKECLAAGAIRSMVAIPFLIISAALAVFFPMAGIAVYQLVIIFELVYLYTVTIRSADARSADRMSFLFPFFVVFSCVVMALSVLIVFAGAGASIYARASEAISLL